MFAAVFVMLELKALEFLAGLLGVEVTAVEGMITQRKMKLVEKPIQLGVQDAKRTRDAVVKSLYEVGGRSGLVRSGSVLCVHVCVAGGCGSV